MGACPGHLTTEVRAVMAGLGAPFHPEVITHAVAVLGTLFADFGTRPARQVMQRRLPDHKIGADGANLLAVLHQPDVVRLTMPTALLQAVLNRGQADLVTIGTRIDAIAHVYHACLPLKKLTFLAPADER